MDGIAAGGKADIVPAPLLDVVIFAGVLDIAGIVQVQYAVLHQSGAGINAMAVKRFVRVQHYGQVFPVEQIAAAHVPPVLDPSRGVKRAVLIKHMVFIADLAQPVGVIQPANRGLNMQLLPVGMLVVLDSVFNRIIRNRGLKRNTWIYIDEIYLFFAGSSMGGAGDNVSKYSAEFLYKCWKRFRKYYATLTGITQNVEECLRSDTARMMFANSEFLLMFNQAPNDREVLAHILNASSAQMSYVSDKPPGHGLIKVGGAIVPLVNEFPKDTSLYWLMTTKPGEG